MMVSFNDDSFEIVPKTMGDLIYLDGLIRRTTGVDVNQDISSFMRSYWSYVCEIEHGNECSLMELYNGGIFDELYNFANGLITLSEVSIVQYLSEMQDSRAMVLMIKLISLYPADMPNPKNDD